MNRPLILLAISMFFMLPTGFSQATRINAVHSFEYDNAQFEAKDSSIIIYKPTNTTMSTGLDHLNGTVGFDTLMLLTHGSAGYYPRLRTLKQYNTTGDLIQQTIQAVDTANKTYKTLTVYHYYTNNTGDTTINTEVRLNTTTGQLTDSSVYLTAYNTNGDMEYYSRTYSPSPTAQNSRYYYTYNTAQQVIKSYTEVQASTGGPWDSAFIETYTYNTSGQIDTQTMFRFDHLTQQFEAWYRLLPTYNSNGDVTLLLTQYFQKANGQWENGGKKETFFDAQFKEYQNKDYTWLTTSSSWSLSRQDSSYQTTSPTATIKEYETYNPSTAQLQSKRKANRTFNSYNQLVRYYTTAWDMGTSTWKHSNGDDSVEYYYDFPVSVADQQLADDVKITLYPNPASNNLHLQFNNSSIQVNTISVFDMAGNRIVHIIERDGMQHKAISVAHLSTGQYILKLNTEQGSITKQFTVLK